MPPTTPPIIVPRDAAAQALGISESTLEGLVRSGQLPPPRKVSANRVGWLWRELVEWSESRPVSNIAPGPGRRTRETEAT